MGPQQYVFSLDSAKAARASGSKVVCLRFLKRRGYRVPVTYVCTWEAHHQYLQENRKLRDAIRSELRGVLRAEKSYAVRSSASVEDDVVHSFAGQFRTILGVQGDEDIMRAVEKIWDSACSPEVQASIREQVGGLESVKMGVLIQEMVPAVVSGVVFSRNPLTGRDEIVVEAVRGSGDALVQQGVTAYRWIWRGKRWVVRSQQADIPEDVIGDVVRQAQRISQAYGRPVNLEWVFDGSVIVWVQLRSITSLETPDVYSNRISREFLPGMIKPLVWSVNVPLVNGAWVWLLTEIVGSNDIDPNRLAKSFYYRAYFNMGIIGQIFELLGFRSDSLELLMGLRDAGGDETPAFRLTPRLLVVLPRLLRCVWDKLWFSRKVAAFLPAARATCANLACTDITCLRDTELLLQFDRLYTMTQEVAYYNIVVKLLADLYTHVLRRYLSRLGVVFERFDLTEGMHSLEQFDPNPHLQRLHRAFCRLDEQLQVGIRQGGCAVLAQSSAAEAFGAGVRRFIEQFGHLSDSGNDFSTPSWREMPDMVLQMVIDAPEAREGTSEKVGLASLQLSWPHRWFFTWIYRRARAFREHREAIGSLNTLGYDLIRRRFIAFGESFARRGLLEAKEDIFYLDLAGIRSSVAQDEDAQRCRNNVVHRKAEMEMYKDINLPSIIYGDHMPAVPDNADSILKGVATSQGRYRGQVKVIMGIQDFSKVQQGEVVVIPYSDVGWTPLFAKAGAVIAESGGMLSHSSIVAREHNIPAVVSVEGACQFPDGALVTVDGYRGEIVVHEGLTARRG